MPHSMAKKKKNMCYDQERAELAVREVDSLLQRVYLRRSLIIQRKRTEQWRRMAVKTRYGRWRLENQQIETVPESLE